jgi:hypothetical protein
MQNVDMLNVVVLNVAILHVIILTVVMLRVMVPSWSVCHNQTLISIKENTFSCHLLSIGTHDSGWT